MDYIARDCPFKITADVTEPATSSVSKEKPAIQQSAGKISRIYAKRSSWQSNFDDKQIIAATPNVSTSTSAGEMTLTRWRPISKNAELYFNTLQTVQRPAVFDEAAIATNYHQEDTDGRQLVRRLCPRRRLRGGVSAESAGSC